MKKFEEGDIFVNKIKTHPKVKFFGYSGKIYIDSTSAQSIKINDFLSVIPPIFIETEDGLLLITEDGDYLILETGDSLSGG